MHYFALFITCFTLLINPRICATENETQKERYSYIIPVVDEMLSSLREKQWDKAYHEFTSSSFQKATSLEKFKNFVMSNDVLVHNKSFQFQSLYFEDHIGTLQGALNSVKGDSLQVEIDLTQEHGKWKIMGIQIFKPETSTLRPDFGSV